MLEVMSEKRYSFDDLNDFQRVKVINLCINYLKSKYKEYGDEEPSKDDLFNEAVDYARCCDWKLVIEYDADYNIEIGRFEKI